MEGSWITEGCLWMLNVVELYPTGVLADWVVVLGLLGLEVKKSIRSIPEESHNSQPLVDHLALRSQEPERIVMLTGKGRSPVKEEERETGKVKNPVNDLMIGSGSVNQGRIDTVTEIVVTGLGTETGIMGVIMNEETVCASPVNVTVAEIETETVSVMVTENVVETAPETGIGTMIGKSQILTVGVPVTERLIMNVVNQSMDEKDMKEFQKQSESMDNMILMSRTMGRNNMIILLLRVIVTLHVIMTVMNRWRLKNTVMTVQFLSPGKRRELEMMNWVTIGLRGLFRATRSDVSCHGQVIWKVKGAISNSLFSVWTCPLFLLLLKTPI